MAAYWDDYQRPHPIRKHTSDFEKAKGELQRYDRTQAAILAAVRIIRGAEDQPDKARVKELLTKQRLLMLAKSTELIPIANKVETSIEKFLANEAQPDVLPPETELAEIVRVRYSAENFETPEKGVGSAGTLRDALANPCDVGVPEFRVQLEVLLWKGDSKRDFPAEVVCLREAQALPVESYFRRKEEEVLPLSEDSVNGEEMADVADEGSLGEMANGADEFDLDVTDDVHSIATAEEFLLLSEDSANSGGTADLAAEDSLGEMAGLAADVHSSPNATTDLHSGETAYVIADVWPCEPTDEVFGNVAGAHSGKTIDIVSDLLDEVIAGVTAAAHSCEATHERCGNAADAHFCEIAGVIADLIAEVTADETAGVHPGETSDVHCSQCNVAVVAPILRFSTSLEVAASGSAAAAPEAGSGSTPSTSATATSEASRSRDSETAKRLEEIWNSFQRPHPAKTLYTNSEEKRTLRRLKSYDLAQCALLTSLRLIRGRGIYQEYLWTELMKKQLALLNEAVVTKFTELSALVDKVKTLIQRLLAPECPAPADLTLPTERELAEVIRVCYRPQAGSFGGTRVITLSQALEKPQHVNSIKFRIQLELLLWKNDNTRFFPAEVLQLREEKLPVEIYFEQKGKEALAPKSRTSSTHRAEKSSSARKSSKSTSARKESSSRNDSKTSSTQKDSKAAHKDSKSASSRRDSKTSSAVKDSHPYRSNEFQRPHPAEKVYAKSSKMAEKLMLYDTVQAAALAGVRIVRRCKELHGNVRELLGRQLSILNRNFEDISAFKELSKLVQKVKNLVDLFLARKSYQDFIPAEIELADIVRVCYKTDFDKDLCSDMRTSSVRTLRDALARPQDVRFAKFRVQLEVLLWKGDKKRDFPVQVVQLMEEQMLPVEVYYGQRAEDVLTLVAMVDYSGIPAPSRFREPEPSRYREPEPIRYREPESTRYREPDPIRYRELEPTIYREPEPRDPRDPMNEIWDNFHRRHPAKTLFPSADEKTLKNIIRRYDLIQAAMLASVRIIRHNYQLTDTARLEILAKHLSLLMSNAESMAMFRELFTVANKVKNSILKVFRKELQPELLPTEQELAEIVRIYYTTDIDLQRNVAVGDANIRTLRDAMDNPENVSIAQYRVQLEVLLWRRNPRRYFPAEIFCMRRRMLLPVESYFKLLEEKQSRLESPPVEVWQKSHPYSGVIAGIGAYGEGSFQTGYLVPSGSRLPEASGSYLAESSRSYLAGSSGRFLAESSGSRLMPAPPAPVEYNRWTAIPAQSVPAPVSIDYGHKSYEKESPRLPQLGKRRGEEGLEDLLNLAEQKVRKSDRHQRVHESCGIIEKALTALTTAQGISGSDRNSLRNLISLTQAEIKKLAQQFPEDGYVREAAVWALSVKVPQVQW